MLVYYSINCVCVQVVRELSIVQERDNYAELCRQSTEELETAKQSEKDIVKELTKCRNELATTQVH